MSKSTIYDVSQLANVSIATVSRVLNTPDRVSEKTRMRVISAIDALDFVPKSEAVARARRDFGRIGILTATSTYDSFIDRLRGLFVALSEHAYEPIIYDVTTNAQRDSYLTSLPSGRLLDGLIIIDLFLSDSAQERLLKYDLPTVNVIPTAKMRADNHLSTIVHDDSEGGRIAATHLLAKGYRRLGYLGDRGRLESLDTYYDEKLDSYRQTLARNGIALPDELVYSGSSSLAPSSSDGMQPAREMMHKLLDLPQPPDAVFAGNDALAIGALHAIRERGLRVPQDIGVIGFDNIAVAKHIGLTTIDQKLKESGRLAAELILKQMKHGDRSIQKIEIPFTLIERETT